jgi:hypothetical protein
MAFCVSNPRRRIIVLLYVSTGDQIAICAICVTPDGFD